MAMRSTPIKIRGENINRFAAALLRWTTEPWFRVEPKEHRRVQVLAAFLLVMTLGTLTGGLILKQNAGDTIWKIIIAVSAVFLITYFISRTRLYKLALVLALVIPAVPPTIIAVLQPPEMNLTADLMWLSLPLLTGSLMLNVRQMIILTCSYIVLTVILSVFGFLELGSAAPLMVYIVVLAFIVSLISTVRRIDLTQIESHISEREQIGNILKESREKYYGLFEHGRDPVFLADTETGRIIDVNKAGADLLGLPKEKIIGMHQSQLHPPDKADKYKEIFKEEASKETAFDDGLEIQTADGRRVPVNVTSSIINLSGKQIIRGVFRDVTERNTMLKKLRESEETFSKAFHVSPDAMSISLMKDGTFLEVNESFTRITGYTRDELIGKNADILNLWANPKVRERQVELLRRHEKMQNEEMEYRNKAGETNIMLVSNEYLEIGGQPCALMVSTDITGRRQAEKALSESEEKFFKAFHAIPEAICISTLEDAVIRDVNERFLRNGTRKREEVIGHNSYELGYWTKEVRDQMIRRVKEQGGVFHEERILAPINGQPRAILFSADIISIGGKPHFVTLVTDISERKQMEQALRESEEKFSKAFKAFPDAVAIATLEDGRYIEVNDRFVVINGYSREEVIGHTSKELDIWINKNDRYRIKKLIDERGHFEDEEFTFRTKTGEIRNVLLSAEIINYGGIPHVLTIGNDVTERKKAERALIESEEKFFKAFHTVPETITISRLKDGVFLDVNDSFCRHNGFNREDVIGHTAEQIGLWTEKDQRKQMTEGLELGGHFENKEFLLRVKSGEMRSFLVSGYLITLGSEPCLLVIGNDITERKRAEEALANEATRKRILIEQSRDGIVILDQYGAVYEANRSFAEMLGYTQEEMAKLHIWDWEFSTTPEKLLDGLRRVDEDGAQYESMNRRKDGSVFDVEISTNGAMFSGQKLIFCVCRDITERKQAEEKLRQTMDELKLAAARLKATNKELESFSYSVSHDLRSPLRSIDGFSQALLEDYAPKLDETAKDYLNRMRNASQKMGELIDGLLKLSRLTRSEIRRETVDLSALAVEISTRLQETSPDRKAEFIIEKSQNASGDPQMLRVMMENLFSNAWKFTRKTENARIEFGGTVNGDKKAFFVKDNGAGFDMTFRDKLFGAFQRLHDASDFPGTGIGLATVQRIINRHGGSIRAEGAVGKGAAFYFTLS